MDTTKPAGVDAAIERLETQVSRLLERCSSLHEENRLLHEQLRQLRSDRAVAKERTEQARHPVEGMIARLFSKHHSTVMYAVENIQKMRQSNPDFDATLTSFRDHFA